MVKSMIPWRKVDLGNLDREMTTLSEEYSANSLPIFKACSLNLVIISDSVEKSESHSETAYLITERHPARVIIILLDPAAAMNGLDTRLSASCRLTASGQKQICCEQIFIKTSGHLTEHVHSVLASVLTADLPVYFWWDGPLPPGDRFTDDLIVQADALMIDSSDNPNPLKALLWLGDLHRQTERLSVADLAWFRLYHWREALIKLFDPPSDISPGDISSITLNHIAGENPPPEALIFGAWMTSRLDWRPKEMVSKGKTRKVIMGKKDHPVNLIFSSLPQGEFSIENINSIVFSTENGQALKLAAATEGGKPCLVTTRSIHPAASMSIAETISRALESFGTGQSFPATLEQLSVIFGT